MPSPVAWWKRDTARNSFYFLCFINGWIFTIFGSYATNQLQTTGLLIGTSSTGGPCTTDCTVLMGTQRLDLQTVLLYLTAMTLGLCGFIALNLAFFADFWKNKSLLVTFCSAIFCVFAIPVYWLTSPTESNFNSLFALSAIFNIMTTLFLSIIGVYIPYCMRIAGQTDSNPTVSKGNTNVSVSSEASTTEVRRNYGFAMSVWGIVFDSGGSSLALVLITILSNKASASSAQHVGLLLTTISGFLTVAGVIGCYFGLPRLPTRKWSRSASELGLPVLALFTRKNSVSLLVSYTIYTNVLFALFSNIFQVYYLQVAPGALQSSLFTLATAMFSCGTYMAYFFVQRKFRFNQEKSLLFGYAFTLISVIWGAIGMSNQDNFGEKHDWEFWVVMLFFQMGQSIVNSTWRLLYSELIPVGEEFLWFGMESVLYCATTWINSVATTPLQTRTNNVRFPLVLCIIFGLVPVAMEALRINLPFFKEDLLQWQNKDDQDASRSMGIKDEVHSEKVAQLHVDEVA